MSNSDLDVALELIKGFESARFQGPRPEEMIREAELALGLTFPPTYRRFLAHLGCGYVYGFEVYGLTEGDFHNSGIPNAIGYTLRERLESNLPTSLVVISDTGVGGYYAIDVSRFTANGENPIVEWCPGLPPNAENSYIIAADFGEFFLERLKSDSGQK